MAIEFHCTHCGKLIKTSGEHAGKRGKCPHCHNSVYIPTPSDEIEPLALAPIDDATEAERQRLLDESRDLARTIREDRTDVPTDKPRATPSAVPMGDARLPSDMEELITEYILCMAAGKLNEAGKLAMEIRMDMNRADEFIQRLTMDELLPARLGKVPRPVVSGFLKELRAS